MPGRRGSFPRPLAALLGAATLLSLAWILFTPALQGPDETGHVAYIQYLAETGHGPTTGDTPGGSQSAELEALTRWRNLVSVLGLATAHPGWTDAEIHAFERDSAHAKRDDGAGPNALAQNPPGYYLYDAVAYKIGTGWQLPTRLLLMRLANLPLLWVLIVAAWVAMGELFRRHPFAQVVSTGAVALLPMVSFMGAIVNPDIALAAVSSAAIALSLVALRTGPRLGLVLGLGALGGLGVLVHGRGLALLPAIAIVLLALLWRARRDGLPWMTKVGGVLGALALMAVGLVVAIVYSNDHAAGTSLTGELSGSSSSGATNISGLFNYVWQFYFSPLTDMKPLDVGGDIGYRQIYVEQFLGGAFGSLDVRLPVAAYRALEIAQAIGLVVLIGAIAARWDAVRRHLPQVGVLALFFVCTLGLLHVAAWQDLSEAGATLMAGRYLLPLVIVFGAAVGFVVLALPRRLGVALGATVLASGTALTIGGIAMSLVRFNA
jgi:4-amino-4-deoxy-L-arabinose transferase-like glycosyltransferase